MIKAYDKEERVAYGRACAVMGNALLGVSDQDRATLLEVSFWRSFPTFSSSCGDAQELFLEALDELACWVESANQHNLKALCDQVAVEHAFLFVGPPKPAAPPWESSYRDASQSSPVDSVGFGMAAVEMRQLFRSLGMTISSERNQYPDHVGLEMLALAVMCERIGEGKRAVEDLCLLTGRILSWIDDLIEQVDKVKPEGFYIRLLKASRALIAMGYHS